MGENPSEFKGKKNLPVENVSWIDAVEFCNKLSVKEGLNPCYSYKKSTNADEWDLDNDEMSDWPENKWKPFNKNFVCDTTADGYRLPTVAEWQWAAMGGLYDMSGNVWEWCGDLDEYLWDSGRSSNRYHCGGSWYYNANYCEVGHKGWRNANYRYYNLGFRIVKSK